MDMLRTVRRTVQRYRLLNPGDTVVIGVSGGPDSLCLLHVLRALAPEFGVRLHVAHLHHGLRGAEADADAAFVAEVAAGYGLPFTGARADVTALASQTGASVEEAARAARYAFLGRLAGQIGAGAVAVGHNADDQAETVLMHLLRGSGLAGLRGMQVSSAFPLSTLTPFDQPLSVAACRLIRPLLFTPRQDILAYCAAHGLTPRFDRSNEDTTFFRNRLRHELLPYLERYNPQIRRILGSTAAVLTDDYDLLRQDLADAWPKVVWRAEADRLILRLDAWRRLPAALQRSVLREAIHRLRATLRNINYIHVDNAFWLLHEGTAGDRMTLPAGLELVLGYDRFAIGAAGVALPLDDLPQLPVDRLSLPLAGYVDLGGWQVETALVARADLPPDWQTNVDPWQAWLDADVLGPEPALRSRQRGESFQPLGMGGRRKPLAEFFTNVKIPAAARPRWPLLVATDGTIAWVCGLRVDERAQVTPATQRVLHVALRKAELQETKGNEGK